MGFKFRDLEHAETDKLPPEAFPGFDKRPDFVRMVGLVEEETGQIVACMMLQEVLHCEGVWLDPGLRRQRPIKSYLYDQLRRFLHDRCYDGFLAQILSPGACKYMERVGAKPLPGQTYFFDCNSVE